MIRHYFLTTIRTLRQNPLYTALSVFGIALTFVFVSVLFLIVESTKGDYTPRKFAERTWLFQYIDNGKGSTIKINKEICEALISKMTTPESILVTSNKLEEFMIMNDQSMGVMALGVDENYFDICRHQFLSGRPISRQEIADALPVTVLDRDVANMYFEKDEDPIGKIFDFNGVQYSVVGIVENASLFSAFNNHGITGANIMVPLKTINAVNQKLAYKIAFTAKDKTSIAEMQSEATRVLEEFNTIEDAEWRIADWQKETLEQTNTMLPGVGVLMACLILIIIPAFNILSLNVSKSFDRSEEIAVRKAFGAPKYTIFGQLFLENFMLTLAGAVIGMCVTPSLLHVIEKAMISISVFPMALSLHFDWKTILLVTGPCVLVFSFLSGSIPAWIIAKREIVNVLKGEAQ